MRIALRYLSANPFRGDDYRLDRKVIDRLKSSIRSTGFWDNLIVRRSPTNPTNYEIAYGHHRLGALHELVTESVIDLDFILEFPVRNLNDSAMVRIMASENLTAHSVHRVCLFIAQETRTPMREITAVDISNFVGYEVWPVARVKYFRKDS